LNLIKNKLINEELEDLSDITIKIKNAFEEMENNKKLDENQILIETINWREEKPLDKITSLFSLLNR